MANQENFLAAYLAGGIAGIAVDLTLFPLDSLKTRVQAYMYKGSYVSRPWSGLLATMAASFPCAAVFWGTYYFAKYLFTTILLLQLAEGALHCLSACFASVCAAFIRNPFEVVKQQAQYGSHSGTINAFKNIAKTRGLKGFYVGLFSLVIREIPFDVIEFCTYEQLKLLNFKIFLAGALAGATAAFLTTPIDVVKTRLMTSPDMYKNVFQCVKKIFQEEGFLKLWSGWQVRVMYLFIGGIIFFSTYEYSFSFISNPQVVLSQFVSSET